jgi:hypothetical protein
MITSSATKITPSVVGAGRFEDPVPQNVRIGAWAVYCALLLRRLAKPECTPQKPEPEPTARWD